MIRTWLSPLVDRKHRANRNATKHRTRRLIVERLEERLCMSGSWVAEAPMLEARISSAGAAINGIFYVAGGSNGHETPTLQAYNPTTNSWTQLADMPSGRYGGDGAAVINGKLYVPGGWDNSYSFLPHNDLFIYDPGSNTWSSGASMPQLSASGACGVINGKLYVAYPDNGYSTPNPDFLDVYHPVSNSWTSLASDPNPHEGPASGVIGGKFYVAGGAANGSYSNVLDVYDPATNTWTTEAPMPTATISAAGGVIDGKLYVVGGYNGTYLDTVQVYDPATNTWTTDTPMLTPQQGLVAGVVNGVLYAVGGGDSTGIIDTNEAFIPAGAASFGVSGFPLTTTAGQSQSFTVTALDPSGNTAAGYTGKVHFSSSDPKAVLPADYTFTSADAGQHTFFATLKTAGNQSITATDTSNAFVTGTESGIAVVAAAPSQLKMFAPSSTIAGTAFNLTVAGLDPYGNVAASYTGTVHFTSSDKKAALPADYTFTATDAGLHTFKVALVTAGSQTITATDTVTATITGKSATIKVSAAAANHFKFKTITSTTAGTPFSITITAQDAFNNTVANYTGTVHFTSSDLQAILPAEYTFTASNKGVQTFSNGVTLKSAGTQTVTATDTVTTSVADSASIAVKPGKASSLSISAPASVTQGVAFTFIVTALDAYGNVATGYTGTVHFSSSDGAASLPANFTFLSADAGVETFSAIFNTTGSQSLTATDTTTSSITGTDSAIQVNAGAAAVRQGSTSLLSALSATDLADRIAKILEKGADNSPL